MSSWKCMWSASGSASWELGFLGTARAVIEQSMSIASLRDRFFVHLACTNVFASKILTPMVLCCNYHSIRWWSGDQESTRCLSSFIILDR